MPMGLERVKRFWRALTARPQPEDERLLRRLSANERALFAQMDSMDQRHCLDVAGAIEPIALRQGILRPQDLKILVRAALLHDIGKVAGDLRLWDRVLIVLVQRLAPGRARQVVARTARELRTTLRRGTDIRSRWRQALYVHWIHPRRGAYMARVFGVEEPVVDLIRRHHTPPGDQDSMLLVTLRTVDRAH